MHIKRLIYPTVLILLILALTFSVVQAIKKNQDPYISAGILILLLAVVVFKNRKYKPNQQQKVAIAAALAGIAVTMLQLELALAYAIVGLGLLIASQIIVMRKSKPAWLIFGGNPLHKLEGDDAKYASLGLSMLLSVAVTFFLKVVWLSSTL